jgi:hypothetical protein
MPLVAFMSQAALLEPTACQLPELRGVESERPSRTRLNAVS